MFEPVAALPTPPQMEAPKTQTWRRRTFSSKCHCEPHRDLARSPMCSTKVRRLNKCVTLQFLWEVANLQDAVRTKDHCNWPTTCQSDSSCGRGHSAVIVHQKLNEIFRINKQAVQLIKTSRPMNPSSSQDNQKWDRTQEPRVEDPHPLLQVVQNLHRPQVGNRQDGALHEKWYDIGTGACFANFGTGKCGNQSAASPTGGGRTVPPPSKPHATGRTGATALTPRAFAFTRPLALPTGLTASPLGAAFLFASNFGFATAGGRGAKVNSPGAGLSPNSTDCLGSTFVLGGSMAQHKKTRKSSSNLIGIATLRSPRHGDGTAVKPEHGAMRETNDSHKKSQTKHPKRLS